MTNDNQDSILLCPEGHGDLLVLMEREQNKLGFLSREFIITLAHSHGISVSEVFGVASFYAFLTDKPQGRNIIRICKNLPCSIKRSETIVDSITRELGIKPGQTTTDGRFTLMLTNCIGACDEAPAMMINNDIYGGLTQNNILEILRSFK